jgi:hypothetical protein
VRLSVVAAETSPRYAAGMTRADASTRPLTIASFEKLFILTVLLSLLHFVHDVATVSNAAIMQVTLLRLVSVTILLILVLLISRRRSQIAKWFLVIYLAVSVPFSLWLMISHMTWSTVATIGALLNLILTIIQVMVISAAIALLFTPTARAWLNRKGAEFRATPGRP